MENVGGRKMKRKNNLKKAWFFLVSICAIFIILSVSIGIPVAQDAKVANQISRNTEEFYEYHLIYAKFVNLLGGKTFLNWYDDTASGLKEEVLEGFCVTAVMSLAILLSVVAILYMVLKVFLPICFVSSVMELAEILTKNSVDLAFYLVDSTDGFPIENAKITLKPIGQEELDITFDSFSADAGSSAGWYFAPGTHTVSTIDLPPGIYTVTIECDGYENYPPFNTDAIKTSGRYGDVIELDPSN